MTIELEKMVQESNNQFDLMITKEIVKYLTYASGELPIQFRSQLNYILNNAAKNPNQLILISKMNEAFLESSYLASIKPYWFKAMKRVYVPDIDSAYSRVGSFFVCDPSELFSVEESFDATSMSIVGKIHYYHGDFLHFIISEALSD